MTVPLAPIDRPKNLLPAGRTGKRGSVNKILRDSYQKFTRDAHTLQAVKLVLRGRG